MHSPPFTHSFVCKLVEEVVGAGDHATSSSCVACRLARDIIQTRSRLAKKKGVNVGQGCYMCSHSVEVDHLFLECPFSKNALLHYAGVTANYWPHLLPATLAGFDVELSLVAWMVRAKGSSMSGIYVGRVNMM